MVKRWNSSLGFVAFKVTDWIRGLPWTPFLKIYTEFESTPIEAFFTPIEREFKK